MNRKPAGKRFRKKDRGIDINTINLLFRELEFGLDIATNTLYLNSEISIDSLYETMGRLNLLLKFNNKNSITLNVSSFGGDVYSMFGIHDFIRTLPVKVNTTCIGPAMSAAAFLLVSGTGVRQMTKNSTVMFHQFSSSVEGKTQSIMLNATHIKKLQDRANELLGIYTKKPKSFWQRVTNEDTFLTAEDCLNYGVVDKII
jgi:ATP-dependent Clp protease protease subunit